MRWNIKIKGGALQFVLFIGVLIALLLSTFIMLAHSHSLFRKKTTLLINTVRKTELALAKAFSTPLALNDSVAIELPIESQTKLKAIKNFWGVFEKYTVVATSNKKHFTKSVLAAYHNQEQLPALYLQDKQRPMIIVGKARITGNAYLPDQGIKPGNIAGNSFYGTALIQGVKLLSSATLPVLNQELLQHINSLSRYQEVETRFETIAFKNKLVASNSFKRQTKIIHGDIIDLTQVSLIGNIIVRATNRIIVDASSELKDVLLLAPNITIKNNVHATFQAIASHSITVGKQCELAYPSALVVNRSIAVKSDDSVSKSILKIDSNCMIKGVLIYLDENNKQNYLHPQLKIENNTQIWGEVYCQKNLELKGEIFGSVKTAGFMALENGSIYQNHLYNGIISSPDLPKNYSGLEFKDEKQSKTIVKWLY